jgi:hypothetical protein
MRGRGALVFGAWLVGLSSPVPSTAQTIRLPATDERWELRGDARVGEMDGEEVLLLRNGIALLPTIEFGEGTIELDLRGTDRRAFAGISLRRDARGDSENLYLRLHKSGLPDALQYTPDFRGHSQWQLYHDARATASARFTPETWQHLRIEVLGDSAALFLGRSRTAALVVPRLVTDVGRGPIGFWVVEPGAGASDPWPVAIRNVTVRPDSAAAGPWVDEASSRGPVAGDVTEPLDGIVEEWSVSESFTRVGPDVLSLPPDVVAGPWRTITADGDGLVPLDRYVERPDGGTPAVLARLRIHSDAERTIRLDLGFSDNASVFLDGRLLYSGRYGFSPNFPRRQGLITLDQAAVYLPLTRGDHDLIVAVGETYGGWGVMGRIRDRAGLEVRPGSGR